MASSRGQVEGTRRWKSAGWMFGTKELAGMMRLMTRSQKTGRSVPIPLHAAQFLLHRTRLETVDAAVLLSDAHGMRGCVVRHPHPKSMSRNSRDGSFPNALCSVLQVIDEDSHCSPLTKILQGRPDTKDRREMTLSPWASTKLLT